MTNLQSLDLGHTQLTTLPAEIGQLTNLQSLDLGHTQLTTLPAEIGQLTYLQELALSHTQLTILPVELGQLTTLHWLNLGGTSLNLPPEITDQGDAPHHILEYYFQPSRPLNEAKVVLVGEGGVGKTSLVRHLLDEIFVSDHDVTEGILVRDWSFDYNDETYRIHLWDFGGQELMHATHQFFMTKRTLYLLVLDASHTDDQNRLHYWLEIIKSFGGDSPIIVVRNHADEGIAPCDERRLLADYPTIQQVYTTSCKTGIGLARLWADLPQHLLTLPHIHDQIPVDWYQVKERCEISQKDFISYERFIEWCEDAGMQYEYEHTRLLRFLHDVGVVLCFQDDWRLAHTPVLNPSWVADGIYRILHARWHIKNGILHIADLAHMLDTKRYPRNMHAFLIDMMQKFELCFPLPGANDQSYLIPDLLPDERPGSDAWTQGWDDSLRFIYQYKEVLPRSILGRLMVRLHALLDHETLWLYGCILNNADPPNQARIELDPRTQQIEVRITGPAATRRDILKILRHHMTLLHRTFADLAVEERVPLPGNTGRTERYLQLVEWEQEGVIENRFAGVPGVVNIPQVLNGIVTPSERTQDYVEHQVRSDDDSFRHLDEAMLSDLEHTYRRSLKHVLEKRAKYGLDVPTSLVHEEHDIRVTLEKLERRKRRR